MTPASRSTKPQPLAPAAQGSDGKHAQVGLPVRHAAGSGTQYGAAGVHGAPAQHSTGPHSMPVVHGPYGHTPASLGPVHGGGMPPQLG